MEFTEDGNFQILLCLTDGARLYSPDGRDEYSVLVPNIQITDMLLYLSENVKGWYSL